MTDEIRREEKGGRGRYVSTTSDGQETEVTFAMAAPDHMVIDYSFVPPAHRGKGLATPLIARAVEDARKGGFRITPTCGYVAAVMRRNKDWADVLAR